VSTQSASNSGITGSGGTQTGTAASTESDDSRSTGSGIIQSGTGATNGASSDDNQVPTGTTNQNGSATAAGQTGTGVPVQNGAPAGDSQTVTVTANHNASPAETPSVSSESAGKSTASNVSGQQASVLVSATGPSHESDSGVASAPRTQDAASGRGSEAGEGVVGASGRADSQPTSGAIATVQEQSLSREDTQGDATSANSLAFANALAADHSLSPQASDLFTGSPALMMKSLQTGIQNFLGELDHLGSAAIASSEGMSPTYWVFTAIAAAGAFEIARRQIGRNRPELETTEPMFSWLPEGNSDSSESES
jgi:hypothetical protein